MVLAFVIHRIRIRLHNHLNVFLGTLVMKVHIDHNAQDIADLVRQVFHQFISISQAYRLMRRVIIHAKEDAASVGIGEAANPLEVFVFPDFFVFYVLTFVHTKLV